MKQYRLVAGIELASESVTQRYPLATVLALSLTAPIAPVS